MDFNDTLKFLSKESRLAEYPNLCAEVTSRFSVLSKKINTIKVCESTASLLETACGAIHYLY